MQIDLLPPDRLERTGPPTASQDLLSRFADDPWALTLGERKQLALALTRSQESWLPRLRRLVEPPLPDADFPAFLLDLPAFARLRNQVGNARSPSQLPTAVADELQRFADHYRSYLVSPGTRIDH